MKMAEKVELCRRAAVCLCVTAANYSAVVGMQMLTRLSLLHGKWILSNVYIYHYMIFSFQRYFLQGQILCYTPFVGDVSP
jgi:hypothetical protein